RLFVIAGRQSRRNRMFLERASDGVHVMDSQGVLIEASDSFCSMLGYPREEIIGKHVSTWEARWSRAELTEKILPDLLAYNAPNTFETLHRRKDGSVLSVEVH